MSKEMGPRERQLREMREARFERAKAFVEFESPLLATKPKARKPAKKKVKRYGRVAKARA